MRCPADFVAIDIHWTWIACKADCTQKMSFIYKYKTPTLTPFVKPRDVLNLTVQNIFYVQSYAESTFMYNLVSTTRSLKIFDTIKIKVA